MGEKNERIFTVRTRVGRKLGWSLHPTDPFSRTHHSESEKSKTPLPSAGWASTMNSHDRAP